MAAPPTNRKRLIFWVTLHTSSHDSELCEILSQDGFEVKIIGSLHELETWALKARPAIIVLTDQGNLDDVRKLLEGLMSLSDLRGAKMVMVSFTGDERIKLLAAGSSFRDIIPSDLPAEEFRNRFRFATAHRPLDPWLSMGGKAPTKEIALRGEMPVKIYLPCRLTQIGSRTIKVESRLHPALGSRIQLTGPLTHALKLPFITLHVSEHLSSGLIHRFSSGFIAQWQYSQPSIGDKIDVNSFWSQIAQRSNEREIRVFVAMSQATIRQAVLNLFHEPSFIVATALQRHSIAAEPQYFAPDFVIFDDILSLEKNGLTLLEVLHQLTENCEVFIYMSSEKNRLLLEKSLEESVYIPYKKRIKIFDHEYLHGQKSLKDLVIKISDEKSLQISREQSHGGKLTHEHHLIDSSDRFHLKSQDAWTYGQLILPAWVTSLHHRFVEVLSPVAIGSFTLLRLKSLEFSQALKRAPYAKVIDEQNLIKPDKDNPSQKKSFYLYRTYLSDLRIEEIHRLAHWNLNVFQESLEKESIIEKKDKLNEDLVSDNLQKEAQGLSITTDAQPSIQNHGTIAMETKTPSMIAGRLDSPTTRTQIAEISKELGREALQSLKDTIGGHETKGLFSSIVPVVVIIGIVLGLLWGLFAYLSQDFQKSGGVYTEQLKNFSN
jgi:hypothetical protein